MTNLVPVLGPGGWVKNTQDRLVSAVGQMMVSEDSQSNVFSEVTSLGWIINTYQTEPEAMQDAMIAELSDYFNRIFGNSEVKVAMDEQSVGVFSIQLSVIVNDGAERAELSRSLTVSNGQLDSLLSGT